MSAKSGEGVMDLFKRILTLLTHKNMDEDEYKEISDNFFRRYDKLKGTKERNERLPCCYIWLLYLILKDHRYSLELSESFSFLFFLKVLFCFSENYWYPIFFLSNKLSTKLSSISIFGSIFFSFLTVDGMFIRFNWK